MVGFTMTISDRVPESSKSIQGLPPSIQRTYYLQFVRKHVQWKLIAMYSDEGITATSTEKRIGLLQMLEDAKAGKFDVIIVKNLSRLSRNLMDCMNIIYALRNLPNPVGIFFESENLYTLDKSADFTLQVLSLVAQEESHKKSEAMLASYYMRFSQGQYLVPDLLGFRKVGKNMIATVEYFDIKGKEDSNMKAKTLWSQLAVTF